MGYPVHLEQRLRGSKKGHRGGVLKEGKILRVFEGHPSSGNETPPQIQLFFAAKMWSTRRASRLARGRGKPE